MNSENADEEEASEETTNDEQEAPNGVQSPATTYQELAEAIMTIERGQSDQNAAENFNRTLQDQGAQVLQKRWAEEEWMVGRYR